MPACTPTQLMALVAAAFSFQQALASPHSLPLHGKRHGSIKSAFSQRTKRQDFLSTTQPSNLAAGTATADEGCTLWITPWSGASCLSVITYSPGLILEDFQDLNPALDASCSNLQTNLAYCIDTDDSHDGQLSTAVNNAVAKPSRASSCGTKKKTSSSKSTSSSKTSSGSSSSSSGKPRVIGGLGAGLLELDDPVCGKSGATKDTTKEGGPNGKTSWLNCGISTTDTSSGWTPPQVTLQEIRYQNMSKTGIYASCAPYFKYFEEAEAKYGVPAIFFAAFAMQESTCQPDAVGDEGGAWGLMQITTDKCGGAPGGNCRDPEYNVMTAAKYFADTLANCGNNPLCAVGQYNGWNKGMSYADATRQATSCCVCQNNLDYMNQFFNAWIHNLNGQEVKLYNNLAVCEGSGHWDNQNS